MPEEGNVISSLQRSYAPNVQILKQTPMFPRLTSVFSTTYFLISALVLLQPFDGSRHRV